MRRILFSVFALVLLLTLTTIGGLTEGEFINVDNIQITPPLPDVPKENANFSGVWEGRIRDRGGYGSSTSSVVRTGNQ